MRYGYHITTNWYPYSATKTHAFKGSSNYRPICGSIIYYVEGRHFISAERLSFAPTPDRNSCQNCAKIVKELSIILDSSSDELTICEDHLRYGTVAKYLCPKCSTILFTSSSLLWTSKYWEHPNKTLQHDNYNNETGILTCPECDYKNKLTFFSYLG